MSKFVNDDFIVEMYGKKELKKRKKIKILEEFNKERESLKKEHLVFLNKQNSILKRSNLKLETRNKIEKSIKQEEDDYKKSLDLLNVKFFNESEKYNDKSSNKMYAWFKSVTNSLSDTTKKNFTSYRESLLYPVEMIIEPLNDFLGVDLIEKTIQGGSLLYNKLKSNKKSNPTTNDVLRSCEEGLGFVYLGNLLTEGINEESSFDMNNILGNTNELKNSILSKLSKKGGVIVSLAWIATDAIGGYVKSEEWKVPGLIGALGGGIAGTGSGIDNALKNATKWATLGFQFGGPFGGAIGAVVGGVLGYIGGERVSKFINLVVDIVGSIAKGDFESANKAIDSYISEGHIKAMEKLSQQEQNRIKAISQVDSLKGSDYQYSINESTLANVAQSVYSFGNYLFGEKKQDFSEESHHALQIKNIRKRRGEFENDELNFIASLSSEDYSALEESLLTDIKYKGNKTISTLFKDSKFFNVGLFESKGGVWEYPNELKNKELDLIEMLSFYMAISDIHNIIEGFSPIDKYLFFKSMFYGENIEKNIHKNQHEYIAIPYEYNKGTGVTKQSGYDYKWVQYQGNQQVWDENTFNDYIIEVKQSDLSPMLQFLYNSETNSYNFIKQYTQDLYDYVKPFLKSNYNLETIDDVGKLKITPSKYFKDGISSSDKFGGNSILSSFTELNDALINNPSFVIDKEGSLYKLHKDDVLVAMKDVTASLQGLYEEWKNQQTEFFNKTSVNKISTDERDNLDKLIVICEEWLKKEPMEIFVPNDISL